MGTVIKLIDGQVIKVRGEDIEVDKAVVAMVEDGSNEGLVIPLTSILYIHDGKKHDE